MPGSMDAYHSECADRGSVVEAYPRLGRSGARSDRAFVSRARSNISSNVPYPDKKGG
jgi:hypothetical protein